MITVITANLSPPAVQDQTDVKQQFGQAAFDELKARGEIIATSPSHDPLVPGACLASAGPSENGDYPF